MTRFAANGLRFERPRETASSSALLGKIPCTNRQPVHYNAGCTGAAASASWIVLQGLDEIGMRNARNGRLVRPLLLGAGGLAVVAFFFFGTLFALDYFAPDTNDPKGRDRVRGEHAKLIQNALERYRSARGAFPTFTTPDSPVDDLRRDLVDGGYLQTVPNDPLRATGRQYRYVSDGKVYGLLFDTELAHGKNPTGGRCLVGTSGRGFWGDPPPCSF
jgi:hypothetical protein